jgi:hypothetical protein
MTTESVNQKTKEIGAMLAKLFKAEGRGLHELITSCENHLSPLALCGLRRVATIRNRLFHEQNFTIDQVPVDFDALCKELLDYIAKGPGEVQKPKQPLADKAQTPKKALMQKSNAEITTHVESGKVSDMNLTPEQQSWYEKYSHRK